MGWIKIVLAVVAVVIGGFLFVANFSSVETRYECSGTLYAGSQSAAETAHIRVEHYRPWINLWSDSDGALWFEIPHKTLEYFEQIEVSSVGLQIGNTDAPFKGTFSTVSRAITINTRLGQFQGACRPVPADA